MAQHRGGAAAEVAEPEQAGLEEIAPDEVEVAVVVGVGQRHGIGAVHAPLSGDDGEALPLLIHQPEHRRAGAPHEFVAEDHAAHPPDEQVGAAVAVHVAHLGDVLPVGEHRHSFGIPQRVRQRHVAGRRLRAIVPEVPQVAEGPLGEQVEVAVAVEVGEAGPLAHLQAGPVPAQEREGRQLVVGGAVAAEGQHLAAPLLDDEVEVAVAVEVGQLGPGHVEAAQKGEGEVAAGGVADGEGANHRAPPGGGSVRCRGGGRPGGRSGAGRQAEQQRR